MNYKRDFIKAITFQEVFPVPYNIKFTEEAKEKFKNYLGKNADLIEYTGSYVVASHTNHGWKEVKPGYFEDYFGVVWNKTLDKTLGIVDDPPLKNPSFENFVFPDPDNIPVYEFIEQHNKRYPDRFHMVSIGFTLYERAWSIVGMENLMLYFLMEPEFVKDLLSRITEYNCRIIDNAASLGVDCVHFGDDWAGQNGLLLGRDLWREFIYPGFHKTCETAKKNGIYVSHHSCGKVQELIPDMIEAGVDVFDPFQPEVMDVFKIKKQYQDQLAFWGGLSVQKTLPYGTSKEVELEARKLLKELAPGGGYIFAPSHVLTDDIPIENMLKVIEIAQNQ
ncbi:uroporphyrinogen decarboxylase family protein [Bacteroidota bacterium]